MNYTNKFGHIDQIVMWASIYSWFGLLVWDELNVQRQHTNTFWKFLLAITNIWWLCVIHQPTRYYGEESEFRMNMLNLSISIGLSHEMYWTCQTSPKGWMILWIKFVELVSQFIFMLSNFCCLNVHNESNVALANIWSSINKNWMENWTSPNLLIIINRVHVSWFLNWMHTSPQSSWLVTYGVVIRTWRHSPISFMIFFLWSSLTT